MKVCKNCGQSVQDIESFCPRCGSREFISGGQGGQRPPQRAPYNPQNDGGAQPSQARTPQMAPPGYRHPNARPNTPPQGQQPNRNVQQRPPQGQPPMGGPQVQQMRPPQGQPSMGGPQGQPMNNGYQNQGPQGQPMRGPQGQPPMGGPQGQPPMGGPQGQPMQGYPNQGPQGQPMNNGYPNMGPQNQFNNDFMNPNDQNMQPGKKGLFGKKGNKPPKQLKAPKPPKQPKAPKQMGANGPMPGQMPGQPQQMDQFEGPMDTVVSIKDWLILLVKMMIPILNIIVIIGAWTGKPMNESVRNYLKLYTFVLVIGVVAAFGLSTMITAALTF